MKIKSVTFKELIAISPSASGGFLRHLGKYSVALQRLYPRAFLTERRQQLPSEIVGAEKAECAAFRVEP
jgi:hypothetical protein